MSQEPQSRAAPSQAAFVDRDDFEPINVSRRPWRKEYDDNLHESLREHSRERERMAADVREIRMAAAVDRRSMVGSTQSDVPRHETNLKPDEDYERIPPKIRRHRRYRSGDVVETLSAVVGQRTTDASDERFGTVNRHLDRSVSPDDDDDDDEFSVARIVRKRSKPEDKESPYTSAAEAVRSRDGYQVYSHSSVVHRESRKSDYLPPPKLPPTQQAVVSARPDPSPKASTNGPKERNIFKSSHENQFSFNNGRSAEVPPAHGVFVVRETPPPEAAAVTTEYSSRGLEENEERGLCLFCGMGGNGKRLSAGPEDQIRPRVLRSLPPPTKNRVSTPIID